MSLERSVFMRDVAVLAQEIPERQCASLFGSAGLHDMNMVRVRPFARSMEERAHGIVWVRQVHITQCGQRRHEGTDGVQPFDRNLDINDWLRLQPRNRRRAVVVDSASEGTKGAGDAI